MVDVVRYLPTLPVYVDVSIKINRRYAMIVFYCDVCGAEMRGEERHFLSVIHFKEELDEKKEVNSMPSIEMCPFCKERVRKALSAMSNELKSEKLRETQRDG